MAHIVEHLPDKCWSLNSNPSSGRVGEREMESRRKLEYSKSEKRRKLESKCHHYIYTHRKRDRERERE
jgi:plasmid stabilization system protein ParE